MNLVPIVPSRLDWPSAIGNFLLNFGTLDYFVFCFLKDNLAEDEFTKVREWHFKDRVERVGQVLHASGAPDKKQREFKYLVERLKPIRELRNHLAHGHLLMSLEEQTLKPSVTIFQAKDLDNQRMAEAKHVEFPELLDALKELTELIEGFERLAVFKEGHAIS